MKNFKVKKVPTITVFNKRYESKTVVSMHYDIDESSFIIPSLYATLEGHKWTVYISGLTNNVDGSEKTTKEVFEIAKKYGFI